MIHLVGSGRYLRLPAPILIERLPPMKARSPKPISVTLWSNPERPVATSQPPMGTGLNRAEVPRQPEEPAS